MFVLMRRQFAGWEGQEEGKEEEGDGGKGGEKEGAESDTVGPSLLLLALFRQTGRGN